MNKLYKHRKVIARILAVLLILAMIVPLLISGITAYADSSKVVTLGADLSDSQRQLILNYFGVTENEVQIITVTNADEHFYLDNIATQQQIGTHTYSCAYVEPTTSGGINIKTVNLNWVTCDMLRNALITSGITSCNIVCAAPMEVSGTGSLTGIFKAYSTISGGVELDDEKMELASEELVMTMSIAEDIGQDEASSMLSEVKEQVIVNEATDQETIEQFVDNYIAEHQIVITDDQKWELVDFLLKLSKQEYDIEEVKQAYSDVVEKIDALKNDAEEAKNFFQKVWEFLKTLWAKITGKYEEVTESEQYQQIVNQIGILADTNDDLLGSDTVVTVTDEASDVEQFINEKESDNESTSTVESGEQDEDEDEGFFSKILNTLKNMLSTDKAEQKEEKSREERNSKKDSNSTSNSSTDSNTSSTSNYSEPANNEETNSQETSESTNGENVITFENIGEITEQNGETVETEESTEVLTEDGVLQYITYELQNGTEVEEESSVQVESHTPTLDELTN
jgi:uncharacterized protein YpuA (DUF1002 family)